MIYDEIEDYMRALRDIVDECSTASKQASHFLNREVTAHNTDEIKDFVDAYERNR